MWYWIGFSCAWILFRIGFRLKVVGKSRIREAWKAGGVLIVANHTSYFDPPVIGVAYGKKTAFLARKTLFKKGFFAWLYPRLNAIPVDQERGDMTSLKRIIKELRNGNPVLIFPEGERSLDGQVKKGEAGVGLVIAKTKAPVLPMKVFGAYEALPRKSKVPKFFTQITVCVGEMIQFPEEQLAIKKREAYQDISDKVIEAIQAIEPS